MERIGKVLHSHTQRSHQQSSNQEQTTKLNKVYYKLNKGQPSASLQEARMSLCTTQKLNIQKLEISSSILSQSTQPRKEGAKGVKRVAQNSENIADNKQVSSRVKTLKSIDYRYGSGTRSNSRDVEGNITARNTKPKQPAVLTSRKPSIKKAGIAFGRSNSNFNSVKQEIQHSNSVEP